MCKKYLPVVNHLGAIMFQFCVSWHWIDVTASIFPAKCGEFLRNIVKTKHLRSYFSGIFLLFPTILDFRKFSFSDIQVFQKSVLSVFCDNPVTGVSKSIFVTWRVVFLLQLYDCFSDEHKERFFSCMDKCYKYMCWPKRSVYFGA